MIKKSLLFILIMIAYPGFAQQDSIHKEILNYSDSRPELIRKGRNFLLERFLEGDFEKVRELKSYLLNDVENKDYAAFYPVENWLLMYWTEEYDELLNSVVNFGEPEIQQFQIMIKPESDMFYPKIRLESIHALEQLKYRLHLSDLSEEEQDFLFLYLNYLLADSDFPPNGQEDLNTLADNFLSKHPGSEYETFVRENIRFRFVPSKWGFAFEFFGGYGLLAGGLAEHYKNNITVGHAFDVEYENLTLYLRNYIGFSSTRQERPFDGGVWEKGSQVNIYLPEVSFGYRLIENNTLKLSPFAGIAAGYISATESDLEKNPELEKVALGYSATYIAGVNLDFKLKWGGLATPGVDPMKTYWFLRVRYGFAAPQFDYPHSGYAGNMHYLTVGIGAVGRGVRRVL